MSWKLIVAVASLLFPWCIRRWILMRVFGYDIDRTAFIGRSIVLCRRLTMGPHSNIADMNVIRYVDEVRLGAHASIGSLNWISARPATYDEGAAKGALRLSALIIEEHASITNRHLVECTDCVRLGAFSTIGGWRSQVLTRGADIKEGRQAAAPLVIGHHCLVGTGSILLKGASLPDYSVLAAGSVLAHRMTETYSLYSGVPAVRVRALDKNLNWFTRTVGQIP